MGPGHRMTKWDRVPSARGRLAGQGQQEAQVRADQRSCREMLYCITKESMAEHLPTNQRLHLTQWAGGGGD